MQSVEGQPPRVIAYASRVLNSPESKYSVTHHEALAVVWALQHFRDLIFGYKITVYTDHSAQWSHVISALESGDDLALPKLPVPFDQFSLQDDVLCRTVTISGDVVTQLVVPAASVNAVLQLLHDSPLAGHPGRDRTLAADRRKYYCPTMLLNIKKHISRCFSCSQTKGTTSTAPILEYPLPAGPFDIVGLDLLQLPRSTQGSGYILVCIDHLSRFVVLAPLRDKSAVSVAHALVSHLTCPYTTPRVLLTDNGTEFKNQILADICSQYGVKQMFLTAHHPASNGLVEHTYRKILEILRHLSGDLHETWEDWLSQVAASINQSINQWGHMPGGASPRQSYDAKPGGPSRLVSMQAPFPSRVSPGKIYRLVQATSSAGVPSASSTRCCLLQKQLGE